MAFRRVSSLVVRGTLVASCAAALLGSSLITPQAANAATSVTSVTSVSTTSAASTPKAGRLSQLWDKQTWGDTSADKNSVDDNGTYNAAKDAGSLYTVSGAIGARSVWNLRDASGKAVTGQGVTVALLDTGIDTTVNGLDATGKVINGPDLSYEANSPDLYDKDGFGHGTHLAGIIAGKDDAVKTDDRTGAIKVSKDDEVGIAPGAKLLSVKVGASDGSADVSQVIAGIDWIVQHRNDNGLKVRVINLAYGTDSAQSYQTDPLAAAAENAWRNGIVVVASAGNAGSTATSLNDPAIDPYVIAVGASDANGSTKGWSNPVAASFTSRGTASRHADLVAPGRSIVSLRDPGSYIDTNNPQGQVAGDRTGTLFRGSGSSQSAAVVSGAAALLLQEFPNLTPDQVKSALVSSATSMSSSNPLDVGAGQVNVSSAMDQAALITTPARLGIARSTAQKFPRATGSGSLEAARGSSHLVDAATGAVLSGEHDIQGQPWVPGTWAPRSVAGKAWSGGTWNGARWTADDWAGANWADSSWTGARWSGVLWSGARWTGARWSDVDWSGAGWSGARWSGARWSASGWL